MPDMRKDYYKKGKHLMPKCEGKRPEYPKKNKKSRIRKCCQPTEDTCQICGMILCSRCKPRHTENQCWEYSVNKTEGKTD